MESNSNPTNTSHDEGFDVVDNVDVEKTEAYIPIVSPMLTVSRASTDIRSFRARENYYISAYLYGVSLKLKIILIFLFKHRPSLFHYIRKQYKGSICLDNIILCLTKIKC